MDEGWDHNSHYHSWLLQHVPARCTVALDLGCGTGAFTRLLAERAERVLGLDLSPEMIRIARERSTGYPNIDWQVADALTWDWPTEQFDCVATIATLHHLPPAMILDKIKRALKPGGVLLALDLYEARTVPELAVKALGLPASVVLGLMHRGIGSGSPELRAAWAEHGRHDVCPALAYVRQACAAVLPGARVKRHLLWRYSIVWTKREQEPENGAGAT